MRKYLTENKQNKAQTLKFTEAETKECEYFSLKFLLVSKNFGKTKFKRVK